MEHLDRDILISRVVDDEATAEDWARLKELAERDPAVWRDLAEAQYVHLALQSGVERAVAIADEIDAPVHEHMRARFAMRAGMAARWGGWVAAAVVALAWAGAGVPGQPGPGSHAGVGPPLTSAQDYLQRYLDLGKRSGQVVEEAPDFLLMSTVPVEGGKGYEVIYVRQILERAFVSDLYGIGQDEAGRPAPVGLDIAYPVTGPM